MEELKPHDYPRLCRFTDWTSSGKTIVFQKIKKNIVIEFEAMNSQSLGRLTRCKCPWIAQQRHALGLDSIYRTCGSNTMA